MPVQGTSSTRNARWILLYSPPKIGKTRLAATMSADCPEVLPAPTLTRLEDMYWCVIDRDGTEVLANHKLEVDQIDISGDLGDMDSLLKAQKEFHAILADRVKTKKTSFLALDTYTTFDEAWNTLLRKQIDQASQPAAFSNALLARHMDFINPLRAHTQLTILFVAHSKSNVAFMDGKESESERVRKAAAAVGGDVAKITPAFSSRAGNFLKGQCGYILPLVATVEKGRETKRAILPYGGRGYEAGGRAPAGLADEEPANLRKFFEKIKGLAA